MTDAEKKRLPDSFIISGLTKVKKTIALIGLI